MEEARTITVSEVAALVEYIARNLVDEPDAVKVEVRPNDAEQSSEPVEGEQVIEAGGGDNIVTLALTVAKDDTGKVIGKQGRIAKAIRTVVRAATVKGDIKYRVDIM